MHTYPLFRLLSAALLCLGLTSCGSGNADVAISKPVTPTPAQSPPTTLTGNWFLSGSRTTQAYPVLSTLLYIQGSTVTGVVAFATQCTNTAYPSFFDTSDMLLIGTIANDGTFQASGTLGGTAFGTVSLALTGNSPLANAPSTWTGKYTLTATPGTGLNTCNVTQSGSFNAAAIAPLTGTYIGKPANSSTPFGPAANVTLQITQSTPAFGANGRPTVPSSSLSATLAITNSPCSFAGSTNSVYPSAIAGDSFYLIFTPGFPYGFLRGTLNDQTAITFSADLTSLAQVNGCAGIATYTFIRQ